MPTLEYVFGCLRQEALATVSVVLDATSRCRLVIFDFESTRCSEWGARRSEKAQNVISKARFRFYALFD